MKVWWKLEEVKTVRSSLTLDELLDEVRARRLIVLRDGTLHEGTREVPPDLQHQVQLHHEAIMAMLRESNIRVCPNPELHRKHGTTWVGKGKYQCDTCARLGI